MEENRIKRMGAWEEAIYNFIFMIPIVGLILAIMWSFDDRYIARRNFARSQFCGLIVAIPCIFILSWIVFSTSGTTTDRAQLAKFLVDFSQYSDGFMMTSLDTKARLGIDGIVVNDSQLNYMVANGIETPIGDDRVENMVVPEGYLIPEAIQMTFDQNSRDDNPIVAYVIDDNNIKNYYHQKTDKVEFYGNKDGEEYHYVTSDGQLFTLPGFPNALEDGTIQYYTSDRKGSYYITSGKSKLEVGDLNVNGDRVNAKKPIQHKDMEKAGKKGIRG